MEEAVKDQVLEVEEEICIEVEELVHQIQEQEEATKTQIKISH